MSRRSERFRTMLEDRAADAVTAAASEAIKPKPKAGGLRERRIEWLSLGLSVVIFGVSFIIGGDALTFVFPLAAGSLLLISATLQKILKNWNVSIVTWALGLLLSALAVERFIAIWIVLDRTFNFVYYVGGLIILTGLVILLQIFRRA